MFVLHIYCTLPSHQLWYDFQTTLNLIYDSTQRKFYTICYVLCRYEQLELPVYDLFKQRADFYHLSFGKIMK